LKQRSTQAWTAGRGKTQRVVEAAEHLGLTQALRPLHDRRRVCLTILAYHRIAPTVSMESYRFDPDLISTTVAEFQWQMEHIRRAMSPVALAQVVEHLDAGAALPARAVAVTFDDGFDDTYRFAFPILRSLDIPATAFVTTGYVDSHQPFWFELTAHIVMRVAPQAIGFPELAAAVPSGSSLPERRRSLRQLLEVMKSLPNERRTSLLQQWSEQFAGQINASLAELGRSLTWREIAEMAAAGMTFGSHTVTHPNLTTLSDSQLRWELQESKRTLEQRLKCTIDTLAYPIGTRSAYDARVTGIAQSSGYRLGLSYVSGANWLGELNRFELRRHNIGLHVSRPYFSAMTTLPAWLE